MISDRSEPELPERASGHQTDEPLTLALASPFRLDRDALPTLIERSDAGWRLVACEECFSAIRTACQRYTPHAALLVLNESTDDAFATSAKLIAEGLVKAVALLDVEYAYFRARRAIQASQTVYCTRNDDFGFVANQLRTCLEQSVSSGHDGRHLAFDELRSKEPILAQLTRREEETWFWLARGLTVKEIAQQLHLAESTVDNRKARVMRKLGVHRTAHLVRLAHRCGLI